MDKDASEILQKRADVERAWREEIRKRISELDSGEVRTISWTEVYAHLSRRIGR